jgi:hypothetical protein
VIVKIFQEMWALRRELRAITPAAREGQPVQN